MVTCPLAPWDSKHPTGLVPNVPHLISGSWEPAPHLDAGSPRIFGLGFLQTPPRGDALALLLTLGSANTWFGDSHPDSYGPCPAHTLQAQLREGDQAPHFPTPGSFESARENQPISNRPRVNWSC